MNRSLVALLGTLLAAGVVGTLVSRDPGHVLLSWGGVSLQTNLWFFLLLLGCVLTAGYLILKVLRLLLASTGLLKRWRSSRRVERARLHTRLGFANLIHGNWAAARKSLLLGADESTSPLANLLGAALAARSLGDEAGENQLLERARRQDGSAPKLVDLWVAQLDLSQGRGSQAIERLRGHGDLPRASRLLLDAYVKSGEWFPAWELLFDRRNHWSKAEHERLVPELALGLLHHWPADARTAASLLAFWSRLPRQQKESPALLAPYAGLLAQAGETAQAEQLLRKAINRGWDESLVECYGELPSTEPASQIKTLEKWLRQHADSAVLMFCLARLYRRSGEQEKARTLIEESLRLAPSRAAQLELAALADDIGDRSTSYPLLLDLAGIRRR